MGRAGRRKSDLTLLFDIIGVVLVFLGPITFFSLVFAGKSGTFGEALYDTLCGFLGVGAYVAPIIFVLLGVILLLGPLKVWSRNAIIGATMMFFVVITWSQMVKGLASDSEIYTGGGMLGLALAKGVQGCFGVTSYIALACSGMIALVVMVGVPLRDVLNRARELGLAGAEVARMRFGTIASESDRRNGKKKPVVGLDDRKPLKARPEPEAVVVVEEREKPPVVINGPSAPPKLKAPETPELLDDLDIPEEEFRVPPLTLLDPPQPPPKRAESELRENIEIIERTLGEFRVNGDVVEICHGPTITRYEIRLAPGIKVNKIVSLADNLAMSLAAIDVRVEAPIPGKSAIGVEVPNKNPAVVGLRECMEGRDAFFKSPSKLTFVLGKDVAGEPRLADLSKMPHMLVAGATNAGKSVCLNTMISSLLFRATPEELKFILIDPKRVELSLFDGIPHLCCPVVKDVRQAAGIFRAAVKEMDSRYDRFSSAAVRNIDGYNKKVPPADRLPYIVIVVDELADLMMQAAAEVETSIARLAQLARATGIHLVIATQRPSVDVVTGLIKANISSRLSFAVSSQVDSRTILDQNGAERLIGRGDMLFLPIDAAKPTRIQGSYVSEAEVGRLVTYLKEQRSPVYTMEPTDLALINGDGIDDGLTDELYELAVRWIVTNGHASTSMIQRRFKIGYTRAARLVDAMEMQGIVGPLDGVKPREVLIRKEDLERVFGGKSSIPPDDFQPDEEEE